MDRCSSISLYSNLEKIEKLFFTILVGFDFSIFFGVTIHIIHMNICIEREREYNIYIYIHRYAIIYTHNHTYCFYNPFTSHRRDHWDDGLHMSHHIVPQIVVFCKELSGSTKKPDEISQKNDFRSTSEPHPFASKDSYWRSPPHRYQYIYIHDISIYLQNSINMHYVLSYMTRVISYYMT